MASLDEQIAALEKAAEAAEAEVSSAAFLEEEAKRKRKREAQERVAEAESRKRKALADRMLDDSPEGAEAVIIEARPYIFIVQAAGNKAYTTWRQGSLDAASDKILKGTREKVQKEDVDRAYAKAGVVKWANGDGIHAPDDNDTEEWRALDGILRANSAFVAQILDRVARLDGAASEARKR